MKTKKNSVELKNECQCSVLTLEDIPGAILNKDPGKYKKNELEWWLKCRGQTVKTKENRSHLCNRVRKCLSKKTPFTVVDPDPGQCHVLQKKITCKSCSPEVSKAEIKSSSSLKPSKSLPVSGWTRSTSELPQKIQSYNDNRTCQVNGKTKLCGKTNRKGMQVLFERLYPLCDVCKN